MIGNSAYKVSPLKNPANDARAVGEALKAMGFDVTLALDLPRAEMLAAARRYTEALATAKPVGLFYFAGHGLQLAWRNYLLPVDAVIERQEDVPRACLDINTVIEGLARAANPMNVIVLDACRENPFGRDWREQGLSPARRAAGHASRLRDRAGQHGDDGAGANGLYTEHLLREMSVPEAKIEDVFKRVRLGVRVPRRARRFRGKAPRLRTISGFHPARGAEEALRRGSRARVQAGAHLVSVRRFGAQVALLEDSTRRYPSGRFSELAQLYLDEPLVALGEKKAEVVASPANPQQGFARADTSYKVGDSTPTPWPTRSRRSCTTTRSRRPWSGSCAPGRVTTPAASPIGWASRCAAASHASPATSSSRRVPAGKQGYTRFSGENRDIGPFTIELSMRIVARETVKVGAGTFDTFRIDGQGVCATAASSRCRS